jgi:hypothetical protein
MTSLQDEEVGGRALEPRMSTATKRYAGKKGFLDEDDKIIRQYDKDGDGVFTIEEAKGMAKDFRSALTSKEMYRKLLIGCGVLLVVSWAGNFGLIYATVALTAQLNVQYGDLTDTAGNIVATKSKGDSAHFTPEFTNENSPEPLRLQDLEVGDWVLFGAIDKTRADLLTIWTNHEAGTSETINYDIDSKSYSRNVNFSSQQINGIGENGDACGLYEGITVDAEFAQSDVFKLECCGDDTALCDVFKAYSGTRKLESLCFSPLSTVIEKIKGKMLLKDLKFGDSILAANKMFQPFVLSQHSHPSKPTEFVQINTEESDAIKSSQPIELTSAHMIFVDGKDEPILAGDVELGDSLIGMNGPTKVTKIDVVMRNGFYAPLIFDATLYVDGILASSMVDANKFRDFLNFGFFKIHIHTFMSRAFAPLFHKLCSKVDSKLCETRVSDGEGGTFNILIQAGIVILNLHPLIQGMFLFLLPAAGAISLIAYYALMGLAPVTFVLGVYMALVKKHSAKSKLA